MRDASYKRYMLAILMVIQAFNYLDGLALGLVLQNIKTDLGLTDTELGFLSGIAFALFYSVMGVPIARWADRGNRVTIISLTTALWSLLVALCGTAMSFMQLVLFRIGVAVGESGCIPPAHSLIADYYSRGERPRATALYMLGSPVAVAVGYFLAGWLNQLYGWRATFIMLGVPGLVPALLAWLTLKEPRRQNTAAGGYAASCPDIAVSTAPRPDLRETYIRLWSNRTFRNVLLCFSIVYFFGSGIAQWQPAFFIRSYGLTTGEIGSWFALIYGLGGILGTFWGGELATRRAARNESLQLRAIAVVYSSFGIVSALTYISPNHYVAFALMAVTGFGSATAIGPLFGTIQSLVPERMRATSIATIYLFANLIGTGLGPLATGALSDSLRPLLGEESLRYALLALCPGYLWGGWHMWRASRTVGDDLKVVEMESRKTRRSVEASVASSRERYIAY
jgi:predicted MFS family arabinose efflux permease